MLKVRQISSDIASIIYAIQKRSFEPLLDKYRDYDIYQVMESIEQIKERIDRANKTAYIFQLDDINVGWVRVTELDDLREGVGRQIE